MTVRVLPSTEVASLQAAPLTYSEVGATRAGDGSATRAGDGATGARPPATLPAGYRHLSRSRRLDARTTWASAVEALLSWQVPDRAGLRVRVSSAVIAQGSVGVLSFGLGRISVRAPVRVVYLDRQDDSCAFAYGTLPGHPEIGEEAFALNRADDGAIVFAITAFSRPGTLLTRVAGPVGSLVQSAATERYLRSL